MFIYCCLSHIHPPNQSVQGVCLPLKVSVSGHELVPSWVTLYQGADKVPADMGKGALFSSTSAELVPLPNFFAGCGVRCRVGCV